MRFTNLKITILVDDKAGEGLMAEHGLSLWIETEDKRILFDTGQGTALPYNAQALGVALDEADILVLSHGHYDHTGGVSHVLKHSHEIEAYCHPGVVLPRYSIRKGTAKTIQMPRESMVAMDRLPARGLHWVRHPAMVCPGIGITGPISRDTSFEDTGGPFFLDSEGRRADSIGDDLALWMSTPEGLIVCVGCCHAGLVNTVNQVCRLSGVPRIRAVIGGFHLLEASDQRIERTVAALLSHSPEIVAPCHCTGDRAVEVLRSVLGERVSPGRAGVTISFH